MEAVSIKVGREDAKAHKDAQNENQRREFKSDLSDLEQYR